MVNNVYFVLIFFATLFFHVILYEVWVFHWKFFCFVFLPLIECEISGSSHNRESISLVFGSGSIDVEPGKEAATKGLVFTHI